MPTTSCSVNLLIPPPCLYPPASQRVLLTFPLALSPHRPFPSRSAPLAPCGSAWLGSAWHGLACLDVAWRGLAWLGPARPGSVWLGFSWLGLAWLGSAWLGSVLLARLGSAWLVMAWQETRRRGLKVAVAGIPKTIDNDIAVRQVLLCLDMEWNNIGVA